MCEWSVDAGLSSSKQRMMRSMTAGVLRRSGRGAVRRKCDVRCRGVAGGGSSSTIKPDEGADDEEAAGEPVRGGGGGREEQGEGPGRHVHRLAGRMDGGKRGNSGLIFNQKIGQMGDMALL